MNDALTGETVELLQQLIRNQCVNDGTVGSGQEVRTSDVLRAYLDGSGLDLEVYEPDGAPGRTSLVARIEGTDPAAPTLCLMGHTDVVPVTPEHWTRDPFGGELVNGEVWGRGAIDMLNLTASQAVALKALARRPGGWRPRGTLVYLACADEEAGGALGAGHVCKRHWDALRADYLLTENGGTVSAHGDELNVTVHVGEKGVAWRRLRVKGTPGHGSMPYGSDNALVKAARVVGRLADYRPAPYVDDLWGAFVGVAEPRSGREGGPGRSLPRRRGHRQASRGPGQVRVVGHAHDLLADRVPRRREDQRHPRRRRHRGRHPDDPRRQRGRGAAASRQGPGRPVGGGGRREALLQAGVGVAHGHARCGTCWGGWSTRTIRAPASCRG